MATYQRKVYDKGGKLLHTGIEDLPSDYGFHKQNQQLDKKDGINTRIYSRTTRTGTNKVVTGYYAKMPDGCKVTGKLVSTQNKYSQKRGKK